MADETGTTMPEEDRMAAEWAAALEESKQGGEVTAPAASDAPTAPPEATLPPQPPRVDTKQKRRSRISRAAGTVNVLALAALMGRERMQAAYAHAIAHEYRFYSYGDSSLLLP